MNLTFEALNYKQVITFLFLFIYHSWKTNFERIPEKEDHEPSPLIYVEKQQRNLAYKRLTREFGILIKNFGEGKIKRRLLEMRINEITDQASIMIPDK